VTGASHGIEKDDHAYVVSIKEREGLAVPAGCECAADEYNEEYDYKHKVALATVGGPTVLNAAVNLDDAAPASSGGTTETMADGGTVEQKEDTECDCANLSGNLPCWPCYRESKSNSSE
jgi:hypothetical protein